MAEQFKQAFHQVGLALANPTVIGFAGGVIVAMLLIK